MARMYRGILVFNVSHVVCLCKEFGKCKIKNSKLKMKTTDEWRIYS